jgi:S-adenosyl-L-methionine hydrolase (adenosine-forming)
MPIVTLTTDFGLIDHYVGTMKGVILSRCPNAQIIDISHQIEQFSILSGAYAISQSAPYFPPGTVHVVVIDPGVGTERKPLLVEAGGQFFIAPDNGVLSFILNRDRTAKTREILNRDLWLPSLSTTFHGRDIFAPTAAALASGKTTPANIGTSVEQPVVLSDLNPQKIGSNSWRGAVLSIDHFGNVISNFHSAEFAAALRNKFTISTGAGRINTARSSFGGAPSDLCFAYSGSSGFIELGMNQGSAANHLQVKVGSVVHLETAD